VELVIKKILGISWNGNISQLQDVLAPRPQIGTNFDCYQNVRIVNLDSHPLPCGNMAAAIAAIYHSAKCQNGKNLTSQPNICSTNDIVVNYKMRLIIYHDANNYSMPTIRK
jgi:hypothetical protein